MGPHEEYLELCAAATANELSAEEQARLNAHLAECPDCRTAMKEYEAVGIKGIPSLAPELARVEESADDSWSVEDAEKRLFRRLNRERETIISGPRVEESPGSIGQRYSYRPSQIRWREVWMPFAAAVLLAVALGVVLYKTGMRRGIDSARVSTPISKDADASLEAQASDAGYEREQLRTKLAESDKAIEDLRRRLAEESKTIQTLQSAKASGGTPGKLDQQPVGTSRGNAGERDSELDSAKARLVELQGALDAASGERKQATARAALLEDKVIELSQMLKERERVLDSREAEVANQQELLDHDRDIRELMGARELYMADVHDVTKAGTNKTYGRVFYTKGKSLIFYAFDLDGKSGLQNASAFQAWGRRGPDKQQARSLGIFYEDNASKKRWVMKASDPKSLQDIDAVFVTVEPNGGSQHPSTKPLLFAYLGVSPNHP